ncbi:MAG TPA: TolC family protein [Vicinamibacteria bacterium]
MFRMMSLLALLSVAPVARAAAQEPTPTPTPTPRAYPRPDATPYPAGPVLELSLDDAVKRTLENNADIRVEKFNPDVAEERVKEQRGVYDPLMSSSLSNASTARRSQSVFSGGSTVDTGNLVYNFSAAEFMRTGGNLRLDFANNRQRISPVGTSTFNPLFNATLNASLTQPFLRNFRIDANRLNLKIAKNNREISDVQFKQTVVNTVASIKQLYYDLLYAIDNLEAQRKSLSLAQKLVDENRIKVRVGTMAPLDVVAAESEQASREEAVILAEAAVLDAEDAIKRAIFPRNDPAVWALRIVPTDRPSAEPVPVDLEAAIARALGQRTDLLAARKNLESAGLTTKYTSNQKLPNLDFIGGYGAAGTGGTAFVRDSPLGPIVQTIPGGYGDALSSVFGRDFPSWNIGVNFSYPLFNRSAEAASARAKLSQQQAEESLSRLEMQVTAEVRTAARAVDTNFKRVASTRAARVLQEQRLDAEEKRFNAGMSTNFLVTQAQRDLALAEVAELRAVADYRKSIVNFERVQEAGGGGLGATITSASSTGARTTTTGTTATGSTPQ